MVVASSLAVTLLGLVVVLGWIADLPQLLQVFPGLVPMPLSVALAFIASGTGLLSLARRWQRTAAIAGGIVISLALLMMTQSFTALTLPTNAISLPTDVDVDIDYRGRISPNTAICFLLCGLSTLILARRPVSGNQRALVNGLMLAVMALSLLPLLGYVFDEEDAFVWADYTRMALHTAIGLLILTLGLFRQNLTARQNLPLLWALSSFYVLVLSIDLHTPLGMAAGMGYVPLIFASLWFKQRFSSFLCAGLATLLVALGYMASDEGRVASEYVMANRALSVLAIWITALVVFWYQEAASRYHAINKRLSLALDAAAMGVWDWDIKSGQVIFSEQWCAMLGYKPTELPATVTTWKNLLHPHEAHMAEHTLNSYLAGEVPEFEINIRMRHKQGYWLWIRSVGKVFEYSETGEPVRMAGIHEDISYRKQSEQQLLLLESAINHSQGGILITDAADIANPRIVYASQSIKELTGYAPDELIGENPNVLQPKPGDQPSQLEVRRDIQRALTERRLFEGVIINTTKEGRNYWARLRVFPITDKYGELLYYGSISIDTTQERLVQEQLRLEQEQFKRAMEASPIGIALVSLDGDWIRVNQALCELFGYSEEELYQTSFQALTHPDDLDLDLTLLEKTLAGEINNYEMEKRYFAKSGDVIWALLTVVLVRDQESKPLHFVSQIQDITVRKTQEEKIKTYTEQLEVSNRELDDFAYIASHDLKEPLRGINNHAQSLLKFYGSSFDERAQRKLSRMAILTERMEQLISDLLYYSRIGRTDDAIEFVSVSSLLHDEVDLIEKLLTDVDARVDIESALPTIRCNRLKLAVVFRNLIINGIKYNDNTEKEVRISFDKVYGRDTNVLYNVFHVSDNGIGIDPMFHESIFKMFKRLNSEKKYGKGTGAGLAFVSKIIDQMGGSIWLDSTPGKGSTFHFYIDRGLYGEDRLDTTDNGSGRQRGRF